MSETFRTTRAADGNFTILKNKLLQDASLTSKARGVATYVLSFPSDWHWSTEILASRLLEGEKSIRGALSELQSKGYMKRSKTKGSDGKWQWDWLMADDIRFEPPSAENGHMDSPAETHISPGKTVSLKRTDAKQANILNDDKPKQYVPKEDLKPSDRSNGSVGTRETSDEQKNSTQQPDHEHSTLENVSEVQKPKSAPTRKQDSVEVAVSSSVDAGSGVEERELMPWQMRDYWGNLVKNPEYVATEEDIRWMTNYYIERGFDADYAARFSRSQLMTPAQREAQQFLDSIDVELSVDEKREFYPLVTKLFGGSWQAGDLAQKLCWGLDGFGSPVAGFRKRLKGLAGGLKAA